MMIAKQGFLLRIMIGESDRREGKPLYEWIVLKAKTEGLAGATVFRGMMGFGASSRIHTSKIMRLSEDLPILIEIVDVREKLESFMKLIDGCTARRRALRMASEVDWIGLCRTRARASLT